MLFEKSRTNGFTLTSEGQRLLGYAVAESELRRVGREDLKLLIDCPGNPLLAAEGLLVLDETWPSYMQGRWSITTVTHVGDTATGYRSSITASGLSS